MPHHRGHVGENDRRFLELEAREGYVRARLRLLTTDEGGRRTPILSGYRACWDICATYEARRTVNDAPLMIEGRDDLALGAEEVVRLHPLAWEFWSNVRPGQMIEMYEGSKMVGVAEVLEHVGPND